MAACAVENECPAKTQAVVTTATVQPVPAFVSADPGDPGRVTRAYVRDLRTGRTDVDGPGARGVSAPVLDRHGPHGRLQQLLARPRAR
ncbi:hypothetical protein [Streptomyces sp. NPDC002788]